MLYLLAPESRETGRALAGERSLGSHRRTDALVEARLGAAARGGDGRLPVLARRPKVSGRTVALVESVADVEA